MSKSQKWKLEWSFYFSLFEQSDVLFSSLQRYGNGNDQPDNQRNPERMQVAASTRRGKKENLKNAFYL